VYRIYTIAVAEINKRLKDLPVQMNESIWHSLQETQHRVQNDCSQLWTPLTGEQYDLREKVYATILAHRQRFRAILNGEPVDEIPELTTADACTGTTEGNAGGSNAGADVKETGSLFV